MAIFLSIDIDIDMAALPLRRTGKYERPVATSSRRTAGRKAFGPFDRFSSRQRPHPLISRAYG
jgi:hypothetical protein